MKKPLISDTKERFYPKLQLDKLQYLKPKLSSL